MENNEPVPPGISPIGKTVYVAFDLPDLQSQLGVVLGTINDGNLIHVELASGEQAGVNKEQLLFLHPDPKLEGSGVLVEQLNRKELNTIVQVQMLNQQGRTGEALELAVKNSKTKQILTLDYNGWIRNESKKEVIIAKAVKKVDSQYIKGPEKASIVGKLAIVHPDLTTDPLQYQGRVGRIAHAQDGTLTVRFPKGVIGQYTDDALLLLKDQKAIFKDLTKNCAILSQADCKSIIKVIAAIAARNYKAALSDAIMGDQVMQYCTIGSHEWVPQKKSIKRKKGNSL